ncbi:MAG: amidohydrolase [Clostridium sp.]
MNFKQEALDLEKDIIAWRRQIHKYPEIGLILPKTADFVRKSLDEMNISYRTYPDHSGIVALLGSGTGKVVAIRADMDGLPIQERTNLEFTSENQNMHACGHDAHTAILLATAKILKQHEHELPGQVKLLFQAAEEGPGGAEPMIRDGALENPHVDYILALHISDRMDCEKFKNGDVLVNHVNVCASDEQLYLTIMGKGGHGATPDQTIDPIAIATLVINNLQYIISREVSPLNSSVVTIATLRAGSGASNVIPDTAEIIGTIRNIDFKSRDFVIQRIREIVDHTVKAMRGEYRLEIRDPYPPLLNDPDVVQEFLASAETILGKKQIHILAQPEMGGEDAAFFFQKVPGCYFYLHAPAPNPLDGNFYSVHNAGFCLDESVLYEGAALFADTAFRLMGK